MWVQEEQLFRVMPSLREEVYLDGRDYLCYLVDVDRTRCCHTRCSDTTDGLPVFLQGSQPALHPLFVLQIDSGHIFCPRLVLVGPHRTVHKDVALPDIQNPIHCLKARNSSTYVSDSTFLWLVR